MADIVREMESVGPDMAEIARRLGLPKEKVSKTFRSNVIERGYGVQGVVNRSAVGLRDTAAIVQVARKYSGCIGYVIDGMDNRWYLTNFAFAYPSGKYYLQFMLPDEHYDEFPLYLERMKEVGLITKVETILRFSWRRFAPMKADQFDFRSGRWDFRLRDATKRNPIAYRGVPRQPLDSTDIAIIEQVLINGLLPNEEIIRRLGLGPEAADLHFGHLRERHLITSYRINWMKSHMNDSLGRPFAPAHRYVFYKVFVFGPTRDELARVSRMMNRLPFLVAENAEPDYAAELAVPHEFVVETMSFLREMLEPVAGKSDYFMLDPARGRTYTPPTRVFDDSSGQWIFDVEGQMELLEEQLRLALEDYEAQQRDGRAGR